MDWVRCRTGSDIVSGAMTTCVGVMMKVWESGGVFTVTPLLAQIGDRIAVSKAFLHTGLDIDLTAKTNGNQKISGESSLGNRIFI